jgi:phosphatidylserine/phosphatidylglycerophosphate/cardiolipin synthase-like enzyme
MRKLLRVKRVGVVVGILAVGALALIGVLSLTRGTPVKAVVVVSDSGAMPRVGDSLFSRSMELYTGLHLTKGNAVEQVNNGEVYTRLWKDLRAARQTITVQMYYSQPGVVADTMALILKERAKAGVRVLLVLDAFGSMNLSEEWADSLRAAKVEIGLLRQLHWYTLHNASDRSHVRVVVIDGEVGYTGGFGLADYWLGDGRQPDQWRDSNVRFEGPAVMGLQAAFAAAWAECTGELIVGDEGIHHDGRRRSGRHPVHLAHHGKHAGGAVQRPLDRQRTEDALRDELVLRPRRRLPEAADRSAQARRGRAHPHREQADGREDDLAGGPLTIRAAAQGRGADLRVSAGDDALEDIHRG